MDFKHNKIFSKKPPYFHIIDCPKDTFKNLNKKINENNFDKNIFFVNLEGQKMTTKLRLFSEFQIAFKFPEYFSNNWDSFEECFNDLSWISNKSYILTISSSLKILNDSDEHDFAIFVDILQNAILFLKQKKVLFHLIFQECDNNFSKFQKKLSSCMINNQIDQLI